jgi:hypothetical protein
VATQVEADQAAAAPLEPPDPVAATPAAHEPTPKEKSAKDTGAKKLAMKTAAKSHQIALFVGQPETKKASGGKSLKATKTAAPRKPK